MNSDDASRPIRVLLVEDNSLDAELFRMALARCTSVPFDAVRVDSLGAAIERAKADPMDVMLLDLGLPDAQGLDTFVRAQAALPEVPIVVLSGHADEEIALRAVQLGAQDYLVKEASVAGVLPRAIRYALERHRTREKLEETSRELREKNALLEEELRMARQLQQVLLPRHYPQISDISGPNMQILQFAHRYQPAVTLSGDFFHILPISDHQAGVFICDVMGHGVRAAFIGAMARGLIQHSAPLATDPGEFLTGLNRQFSATLKQTGIEAFASAFYFVADLEERQLHYASAGHPKALMLRREVGAVDWLQKENQSPLGLIGDTVYRTSQTGLAGHDSIVLCTDGLPEQENSTGEQFGHQRLFDAVSERLREPCSILLDAVVNEAQRFSGQEDFDADVCLVGMDVLNGPRFDANAA